MVTATLAAAPTTTTTTSPSTKTECGTANGFKHHGGKDFSPVWGLNPHLPPSPAHSSTLQGQPLCTSGDGSQNSGILSAELGTVPTGPCLSAAASSEASCCTLDWDLSQLPVAGINKRYFVSQECVDNRCGSLQDFSSNNFEADIRILKSLLETNNKTELAKNYQSLREIFTTDYQYIENCRVQARALASNTNAKHDGKAGEDNDTFPHNSPPVTKVHSAPTLTPHQTDIAGHGGISHPAGFTPELDPWLGSPLLHACLDRTTKPGDTGRLSRWASIPDIYGLTRTWDQRAANPITVAGDFSGFERGGNKSADANTTSAPSPPYLISSDPLLKSGKVSSPHTRKPPSFVAEIKDQRDLDQTPNNTNDFDCEPYCTQTKARKLVIRQTKASLLRRHIRGKGSLSQVLAGHFSSLKRASCHQPPGESADVKPSRHDGDVSSKSRVSRKDTTFSGLPLTSKFGQRKPAARGNMAGREGPTTLARSPASRKKMAGDKRRVGVKPESGHAEGDREEKTQKTRATVPVLNFMKETQCRLSRLKPPAVGQDDLACSKTKTGESKAPEKQTKKLPRLSEHGDLGLKGQTSSSTKKHERVLDSNQDDEHCPVMGEFFQGEIIQTNSRNTQDTIVCPKPEVDSCLGSGDSNPAPHQAGHSLSPNCDANSVSGQVETRQTSLAHSPKTPRAKTIDAANSKGHAKTKQDISLATKLEKSATRLAHKTSSVSSESKTSEVLKVKTTSSKTSTNHSSSVSSTSSLVSSRLPTMTSANIASKNSRDRSRPKSPQIIKDDPQTTKLETSRNVSRLSTSRPSKNLNDSSAGDVKSLTLKKDAIAEKNLSSSQKLSTKTRDSLADSKTGVKMDIGNDEGGVHLVSDTGHPDHNADLNPKIFLGDKQAGGNKRRDEDKKPSSERARKNSSIDSDTNKASVDNGIVCADHVVSGSQESQSSTRRVSVINSRTKSAGAPQLTCAGIPAAGSEFGTAGSCDSAIDQSADENLAPLTGRSVAAGQGPLPSDGQTVPGSDGRGVGGVGASATQGRNLKITPKTPPLRHRKNVKENVNIRVQSETGSNPSASNIQTSVEGGVVTSARPADGVSKTRDLSKPAAKSKVLKGTVKTGSNCVSPNTESRGEKGDICPEVKPNTQDASADTARGELTSEVQSSEVIDTTSESRSKTKTQNPDLSQNSTTAARSKLARGCLTSASSTSTTMSQKSKLSVPKSSRTPYVSKLGTFKDGQSSHTHNATGVRHGHLSNRAALRKPSPHRTSSTPSTCETTSLSDARSVTSSVSDIRSVTSSISDIRSVTSPSTRESSVDSRFGDESSTPSLAKINPPPKQISSTTNSSLSSSPSSLGARSRTAAVLKSTSSKSPLEKKQTNLVKSKKPSSLSSKSTIDSRTVEKQTQDSQSFNNQRSESEKIIETPAKSVQEPSCTIAVSGTTILSTSTSTPAAAATSESASTSVSAHTTPSTCTTASSPSSANPRAQSNLSSQLRPSDKPSPTLTKRKTPGSEPDSHNSKQASKHTSRQMPAKTGSQRLGVKKENNAIVHGSGKAQKDRDSNLDDTRETTQEISKPTSGKGRVASLADRKSRKEELTKRTGIPRQRPSPAASAKTDNQRENNNTGSGDGENCLVLKSNKGKEGRQARGRTLLHTDTNLADGSGCVAAPGMSVGSLPRPANDGYGCREQSLTGEEAKRTEKKTHSPIDRDRGGQDRQKESASTVVECEVRSVVQADGEMGVEIKTDESGVSAKVGQGCGIQEPEQEVEVSREARRPEMLTVARAASPGNLASVSVADDTRHQASVPPGGSQTPGVQHDREVNGNKLCVDLQKEGVARSQEPEATKCESGSETKGYVETETPCSFNEMERDKDDDNDDDRHSGKAGNQPDIRVFARLVDERMCGESEVSLCESVQRGGDGAVIDPMDTERDKRRIPESLGHCTVTDQQGILESPTHGQLQSGAGGRDGGWQGEEGEWRGLDDKPDVACSGLPGAHPITGPSLSADLARDGRASDFPGERFPGLVCSRPHSQLSPASAPTALTAKQPNRSALQPGTNTARSNVLLGQEPNSSNTQRGSVEPATLRAPGRSVTHSALGVETVTVGSSSEPVSGVGGVGKPGSSARSIHTREVNSQTSIEGRALPVSHTSDRDRQTGQVGENVESKRASPVGLETENEEKKTFAQTLLSAERDKISAHPNMLISAGLKSEGRRSSICRASVSSSTTSRAGSSSTFSPSAGAAVKNNNIGADGDGLDSVKSGDGGDGGIVPGLEADSQNLGLRGRGKCGERQGGHTSSGRGKKKKEKEEKKDEKKESAVKDAINSESLQTDICGEGGGGEGLGGGVLRPGKAQSATRGEAKPKTEAIKPGSRLARMGELERNRGRETKIGLAKPGVLQSSSLALPQSGLRGSGGVRAEGKKERGRQEGRGEVNTREQSDCSPSEVGDGFTGDRAEGGVAGTGEGYLHTLGNSNPSRSSSGSGNHSNSSSSSDNNTAVLEPVPSGARPTPVTHHHPHNQGGRGNSGSDETCAVERRRSLLRQKLQNCSSNSSTENRRVKHQPKQQQQQQQQQQHRTHQRHIDRSPSWISASESSFVFYSQSDCDDDGEEGAEVPTEVSGATRCERDSTRKSGSSVPGVGTDAPNHGRRKLPHLGRI
ncbi:hypothetical protein EGW08_009718 [Elysia chlorotica]|uniref:Uncharacterized protein n=1 Tax=Elysia chlorotica TaxID=188477 RepID=A0A3S1B8R7_ELYCH|nr:hypothetical protein EGW08_009718 [Elysia chlorotica]